MAKDIKVKFAGVESEPYDGTLTILYIPDQRQVLEKGKEYRFILEGFTFAEKDTGEDKEKEREEDGE